MQTKTQEKVTRCVVKGCDSRVAGKDSFRCEKHELAYYTATALYHPAQSQTRKERYSHE